VQKKTQLTLYSTEYCELCEHALDLILRVDVSPEVISTLNIVDIVDDPLLMEEFGEHIPVLLISNTDSTDLLFWPFGEDEIKRKLG